jgi:hypothetical protein
MDILRPNWHGVPPLRERLLADQRHVGLGQEDRPLPGGGEEEGDVAVAAFGGAQDLRPVELAAGEKAIDGLAVGAQLGPRCRDSGLCGNSAAP